MTDAHPQSALDYARVATVIRYLRDNAPRQPPLAELAAVAHVSPEHFQRLFTAWAGISPKQFARTLTLDYAKGLLTGPRAPSLFDVAAQSQLSGPSRLHDAFVRLEAVTPGEFRTGGRDICIHWAFAKTRFGDALIASTDRGICSLGFYDDRAKALEVLRQRYPYAELRERSPDRLQLAALDSVNGAAADPRRPLALHVRGTPFQEQVWRALLQIPPGAATSYGRIGGSLGQAPGASQAIGGAVGANPVAWLIPCHRVLRGDGALGGYAWGLDRKCAMLGVEARAPGPSPDLR